MLASIKMISVFLLCFMLQVSSCNTENSNITSVEQTIGKLSDAAAYAETLEPSLKDDIFSILKDRFYKPFLKGIGADPNVQLMQLSADQQKAWHKVYLLFIDLYRIFDKALEPIITKCKAGSPEEELEDLGKGSLELMETIFSPQKTLSENANGLDLDDSENGTNKQILTTFKQLSVTIQEHYVNPFNSYVDGGDFETFEKSVDKGREEIYQLMVDFMKDLSKEEAEEGDGA